MAAKLAELIRRARRLAAERDRLIETMAAEWTHALRGQQLSAADLEEFWAGLAEDAVRWGGSEKVGKWTAAGLANGGPGGGGAGPREGGGCAQ